MTIIVNVDRRSLLYCNAESIRIVSEEQSMFVDTSAVRDQHPRACTRVNFVTRL